MSTGTALRPTAARARCRHGRFLAAGADTCHCGQHTTPVATRPRLSLVKPIPPLTHRHPLRTAISEVAAGRAAMAARAARLQVPVLAWHGHPDGTATVRLADGTHLHHRTGTPAPFTALVPCPLGAAHAYPVAGPLDLYTARSSADACTTPHADFTDWATTAARDLTAAFTCRRVPGTARVLTLAAKAAQTGGRTS